MDGWTNNRGHEVPVSQKPSGREVTRTNSPGPTGLAHPDTPCQVFVLASAQITSLRPTARASPSTGPQDWLSSPPLDLIDVGYLGGYRATGWCAQPRLNLIDDGGRPALVAGKSASESQAHAAFEPPSGSFSTISSRFPFIIVLCGVAPPTAGLSLPPWRDWWLPRSLSSTTSTHVLTDPPPPYFPWGTAPMVWLSDPRPG